MSLFKKRGEKSGGSEKGRSGARSPVRLMAGLVMAALFALLASDLVISRTAYWFYLPWTGPLARQSVKITCVLKSGSAGEVVLVGDSRVRHDFVGAVIEEELAGRGGLTVMNLGLDAAQLIGMREIVRRVTVLPAKPKIIVVGVSAFTVNDHNTRLQRDLRLYASPAMMARGFFSCPDFEQKTGALQGLAKGIEVIMQTPSLGKFEGMCAYNRACRGGAYFYPLSAAAAAQNEKAVAFHGEASMQRAYEREVARYKNEYMKDFATGDFTGVLWRELLDRARESGARVVVVNMPESEKFRSDTEGLGRDRAEAYLERTCREAGVQYLDLNRGGYKREADDFFDYAAHLLPEPAIELSRKLAREALIPLLKKPGMNP